MSVKGKVKRLNKENKRLEDELETYKLFNSRLREKMAMQTSNELLENIIKFAITNHVGGLRAGMAIDWFGIDKMSDLKLDIDRNAMEHAYILRVRY